MIHKISLLMGDPSGDGHDKRSNFAIKSNLDRSQIIRAYSRGVAIGLPNVEKDLCEEYEDSKISNDTLKLFVEKGFDPNEIWEYQYYNKIGKPEGSYSLDTDSFAKLYLFVVLIGDPTFEWEIDTETSEIDIGGYGLFY